MQGYKTITFNAVMAAIAIIKLVWPEAELPTNQVITDQFDVAWAAINTITITGNTVLRFFTKSVIFNKEKK
jgi:hypothetical protein